MKYIVVAILSAVIIVSVSCNSRSTTQKENAKLATDSRNFLSAEKNYENYCSGCHGAEMIAFVDRSWKNGNSKQDIMGSIKNGLLTDGMPAYDTTFTQQEVEELAEFIIKGIEKTETFGITSVIAPTYYKSQYHNLKIDTIISGIEVPWGIKVAQDGTVFYTERKGTLNVKAPSGETVQIKNLPQVNNRGQGGMLDLALHPNYSENQLVYLSYSKVHSENSELSTTAVVRGKLKGDALVEQEEVFEALPYSEMNHHYGSRLVFDDQGYLFISIGERGNRDENPQSLERHGGKIHRIFDDGTIPEDNPFYNTENAVKSIWTFGNRNPQGMVYDSNTQSIWEHEHGPRGGDELNLIQKGSNYGWPIASYGINYNGTTFTDEVDRDEFQSPINYWIPSIAPSGMALISGDTYGKWNGDFLIGSLRFNYVSRVKVSGGKVVEEEKILQDIGRVRSIEMGQDGYVYVGVESPGRIYRVSVIDELPKMENKDISFETTKIKQVSGIMSPESIIYNKETDAIYVSQLPDYGVEGTGNGKIAKLSPEGEIIDLDFITGLNYPHGLAIYDGKLYTADDNHLIEIDMATQKILNKYQGENAIYLNDVTIDVNGDVYVSDMRKSSIYKLTDGMFEEWLDSPELDNPNGLLIDGESMYISSWGQEDEKGTLLKLDLKTQKIESVTPYKLGNLDGVQRYDSSNYIVSDWVGGAVYSVSTLDQHPTRIITTEYSVGDILFTPENGYLYLPLNYQKKIVIYQFSRM